ncbi:hypothetical protein Trydic_g3385 [Trypoxylus dichotomus]
MQETGSLRSSKWSEQKRAITATKNQFITASSKLIQTVHTVKHGAVMITGFFGDTAADLIKIDGVLSKEGYPRFLRENNVLSGKRLCGQNFIRVSSATELWQKLHVA